MKKRLAFGWHRGLAVLLAGVALAALMAVAPRVMAEPSSALQTNPFAGPVRLVLPPRIYAVPGVEMNVYFDNVCLVINPLNYVFDVTCDKGKQQTERWTYVPVAQDVGEYPFVVEVRDETNGLIARAESVLEVVPEKSGEDVPVTVLMIGDSLTHAAVYPQRLLTLCCTNGNPRVTLVGHAPNEKNPVVRIEGYGGWTAQRFATYYRAGGRAVGDWKAWNSSSSPFLYADVPGKAKLDFARYCREFNEGKSPDFVTILLGCNDIFGSNDGTIDATVDTMFTYYDQLVEMIRSVGSETKIGVMLLSPPAGTQDAFGANYLCKLTRWQFKRNQHRVVERLMEKYGGREAEGIFLVPANLNLDCMHNYPTLTTACNSQTQTQVTRLNNGVHPSAEGYRQIGDTLYSWIKARLAERQRAGSNKGL